MHVDRRVYLVALAALTMAYGWGYRGVVGHEAGAMSAGAMLGLALCIGSGRADWQQRAAVVALFTAAGFSWGGSLSYMEHTLFSVSDSFPDVAYGYAMLFFLGALWAGIAGAVCGLAFTLPRSQLHGLARVFLSLGVAYLAAYLVLFFNPPLKETYELITADHFHDGEWIAALIALAVAAAFLAVRRDRAAATLFLACAVAWWIGYLALTKFGGIALAPPFRSESWGGVLGILVVLIVYLVRTRNRAALMCCRYGILGGGFGFVLAVFVRHPVRVATGPLAQLPQWKIAEESFGLLLGVALALAVLRFERGGLVAAREDAPRKPLDIVSVFVVLVALTWMNTRRAPMDWLHRYKVVPNEPMLRVMPWVWFAVAGAILTLPAVYALYLYQRDRLVVAPATARGKAVLLLVLLLWISAVGAFVETFPAGFDTGAMLVHTSFVALAAVVTMMALVPRGNAGLSAARSSAGPDDACWRAGLPFASACLAAPVLIVVVTVASMAMQDGTANGARLRFGPDAYWREQSAMMGTWTVIGQSAKTDPAAPLSPQSEIVSFVFTPSRRVHVVYADGTRVTDLHAWHYMNSLTHLDWNTRNTDLGDDVTVPITLRNRRMYIPWPPNAPNGTYLVLESAETGS